jgi:hypothetical protein
MAYHDTEDQREQQIESDGKQYGATRYYNAILDQPKNGGSYKPQPRAAEQDRHYHSRHDHGYQVITRLLRLQSGKPKATEG